jgi:hypothetical protein
MASGGTYRIDDWESPAPVETDWPDSDDVIDDGLNGIPIKSDYKVHTWNIGSLEGCDFESLADKVDSQQSNNSQLSELETDPYNASLADTAYGTETYTDFIIRPLNRRRGLPLYENVQVTFVVMVS